MVTGLGPASGINSTTPPLKFCPYRHDPVSIVNLNGEMVEGIERAIERVRAGRCIYVYDC
jgi:hypothetical protein